MGTASKTHGTGRIEVRLMSHKGEWFVIPGAATGELAGLRGEGGFEAELGEHAAVTLDYWFEE
jgi:Protein of unknown function (DUF3224)